jgi:L-asparaginase
MNSKRETQKKILILHTGGTIGMGIDTPSPSKKTLAPDHRFVKTLRSRVPELWEIGKLDIRSVANKDSSQITPKDWNKLTQWIEDFYDAYDGFVITHGTDTMAYTGTALSYLLPFPCKPIVLTGSQRPLLAIQNDARRNLVHSVLHAHAQKNCEVSLFFDQVLLRANRTKKMHIEEFHAFDSPNLEPLAIEKLITHHAPLRRERLNRPSLLREFDTRIQVIKAFPGAHYDLYKGAKAVILEAFGCGNLPFEESTMLSFLKKCKTKKIPVILCSQVVSGSLQPELYEMGRKALELGAISSLDMTFEATLVKSMLLAGNAIAYNDWKPGIQTNWAGEITIVEN